jgi:uncharacterized protein (DUF697 family)
LRRLLHKTHLSTIQREKSHASEIMELSPTELPANAPIPTLWLFGKTGSGKTSIVRYLTGASDAEVGAGFRPQTKFSRRYDFPDPQFPIAQFLDTRGLGEARYDPTDDVTEFNQSAQLMIVTVRAMDEALEDVILPLTQLRKSNPLRPVLLAITCLHDGYPSQQHPESDSELDLFTDLDSLDSGEDVPGKLRRCLSAKLKRFEKLVDRIVAIDLTQPSEGFCDPELGGQRLKSAILELLPASYRQTFIQLDQLNHRFAEAHQRRVAPVILAHSVAAAAAAAVPLPWADIPLVLGIQSRLAYKIAKMNHQPLDKKTIAQVSAAMGGRVALQMGIRESLKFIPWLGIAANVAATFAFTFAAGWAWNWYFMQVAAGHVPTTEELQTVYRDQLKRGEQFWKSSKPTD